MYSQYRTVGDVGAHNAQALAMTYRMCPLVPYTECVLSTECVIYTECVLYIECVL
jgi:hypothetical protein